MSEIVKRAEFNFIRYANCWEDADVLMQGLRIRQGDKCLSIASAGDNSLSLLAYNPEIVIAADINPTQIACLELRIAAFKNLEYEEILELLGIQESDKRILLYEKIRRDLSEESRLFFENNRPMIATGIIFSGKFENYFRLFRTKVLPLIHKRKTVLELIAEKSIEEQHQFYKNKWNNRRYRILFRLFFGKKNLGKRGRDPAFFQYVEGSVADRILKRSEYALTEINNHGNPYLNFILLGNFPKYALPHYLRRENFNKIKTNIGHITPFKGSISQAIDRYPDVKFNAFNLSDIFEYISHDEFIQELWKIRQASASGARIVYWDMLAGRFLPEQDSPFAWNKELSEMLFGQDKAFFYNYLIVGETE